MVIHDSSPVVTLPIYCTGVAKRVLPRLRECSRQVEAEVVSNSSNKIHQTWGPPFSRALYLLHGRNDVIEWKGRNDPKLSKKVAKKCALIGVCLHKFLHTLSSILKSYHPDTYSTYSPKFMCPCERLRDHYLFGSRNLLQTMHTFRVTTAIFERGCGS